jgi:tetratricopeptide (TPR) repeat protein
VVETGDVRHPDTSAVMTRWAEAGCRVDVVILIALRLEHDAVLQVDAGAAPESTWERTAGPSGLPVAFQSFEARAGRPLRVAAAVAADMGATAAANVLLPLVEALKPRCVAMCGVCAGHPKKTELGDVVAASRVFYHDTGKRLPDQVQRDLTTYQLRDDWKAALAGLDVLAKFRGTDWFATRPLTTMWRERRTLVALHSGDPEPWHDLDQKTWAATVTTLQEQKLLAGRELTDERNPDAFQPALAISLNNLGGILSNLGQREAAHEATREAVELYRALAVRNPDAFRSALAASLSNLGGMLNDLGQWEAAHEATHEVVELYRALAVRKPRCVSARPRDQLEQPECRPEQPGAAGGGARGYPRGGGAVPHSGCTQPRCVPAGPREQLEQPGRDVEQPGAAGGSARGHRRAMELYRALGARNPDAFQPVPSDN